MDNQEALMVTTWKRVAETGLENPLRTVVKTPCGYPETGCGDLENMLRQLLELLYRISSKLAERILACCRDSLKIRYENRRKHATDPSLCPYHNGTNEEELRILLEKAKNYNFKTHALGRFLRT